LLGLRLTGVFFGGMLLLLGCWFFFAFACSYCFSL